MTLADKKEDPNPDPQACWQQLRHSAEVRELQSAFACATGLPLCLLPPSTLADGSAKPGEKTSSPLHVSGCMGDCSGPICQQALLRAEKKAVASAQPIRFGCPAGLLKIVVSVISCRRHVASVLIGPFALKKLDGVLFEDLVARLGQRKIEGQSQQLRASWKFGPVLTPSQCEAATKLASVFAGYLAECALRLVSPPAHQPFPALLQVIEAMLAEDPDAAISLKQVSERVHLSPCHFCKVFKEQTGLTFSAYRTRLRISRAKQLLLDPHLTIGEVAFEVGFNSIPYFNQAFRRYAGCSPSQYRASIQSSN